MAVRYGSCVISLACSLTAAISGVLAGSVGGTASTTDGLRVFDLRVGGSDPFVRPHALANSEAVDMVALPDGEIVVLLARGAPSLMRIDRQSRGHAVPVPADVNPDYGNSVVAAPGGALLFSERGRVLRVEHDGRVVTVAGGLRRQSASGDGGLAVGAGMDPTGLALLPDGSVLIADRRNHRVRRVDPTGQISTVAGTGAAGRRGRRRAGHRGATRGARLPCRIPRRLVPDRGRTPSCPRAPSGRRGADHHRHGSRALEAKAMPQRARSRRHRSASRRMRAPAKLRFSRMVDS